MIRVWGPLGFCFKVTWKTRQPRRQIGSVGTSAVQIGRRVPPVASGCCVPVGKQPPPCPLVYIGSNIKAVLSPCVRRGWLSRVSDLNKKKRTSPGTRFSQTHLVHEALYPWDSVLINRRWRGLGGLTVEQVIGSILDELLWYNISTWSSSSSTSFFMSSGSLSNMAPEYFLKNIYIYLYIYI